MIMMKQSYDKKNIEELDLFINTIFPDKDLKSFYMSVLSSGLQGKNLEKFHPDTLRTLIYID